MCLDDKHKPPTKIDGAAVLEWAWSGAKPFGVLLYDTGEAAAEIFGLAVCKYPGKDDFYRFSCNSEWEVEQDSSCNSVEEAKNKLPRQYRNVEAQWLKYV